MPRTLIRLRKKYFLPVKYFFTKQEMIHEMDVRSKHEIERKLSDLKELLLEEERKVKSHPNKDELNKLQNQIEILKWLIYDSSK